MQESSSHMRSLKIMLWLTPLRNMNLPCVQCRWGGSVFSCFESQIMRCSPDPCSRFQSEIDRWEPPLWTLSGVGLCIMALHLEERSGRLHGVLDEDVTRLYCLACYCQATKVAHFLHKFPSGENSLWCLTCHGLVMYELWDRDPK